MSKETILRAQILFFVPYTLSKSEQQPADNMLTISFIIRKLARKSSNVITASNINTKENCIYVENEEKKQTMI